MGCRDRDRAARSRSSPTARPRSQITSVFDGAGATATRTATIRFCRRAPLLGPSPPSTAPRSTSTSASRPRPPPAPTATTRSSVSSTAGAGRSSASATHAAVARRRLRRLQHERPRLGRLLRRPPTANRLAAGLRRGLHPPDGHPLRGPRRAGASPAASPTQGVADGPRRDRRHRRLLRRRHLDGARPRCATARCSPDGSLVPWAAPAASRCRSPPPRPRSPGPTSPTRCSPTAPPSTTSPTRPTSARRRPPIGVMKQSFVAGLYAAGLGDRQLRAARHRPRRRPDQLVRARSTPASPTTRTRSRRTSSTSSPPTTPRTTSTTRSRPRRC